MPHCVLPAPIPDGAVQDHVGQAHEHQGQYLSQDYHDRCFHLLPPFLKIADKVQRNMMEWVTMPWVSMGVAEISSVAVLTRQHTDDECWDRRRSRHLQT